MIIGRALWFPLAAALTLNACQSTAPEAPLPSTPITARGQEPGWILHLDQNTLSLNYHYGEDQITTTAPKPRRTQNGVRYQTRESGEHLVVDIIHNDCRDSMSGIPYPYSARVQIQEETLQGCAGEPKQLLLGEPWLVESINGEETTDRTRTTIQFTDEGRIQGQSGCNRYFGRYQLTGEGLHTQGLAQTRMACPDALMRQEDRMLKVLRELRRFERPDEGVLVLYGSENQQLRASRP